MVQISMAVLLFVFQRVFPVFLLIVCGWLVKRKGIAGEGFFKGASKVVFNLALPALAFLKISPLDFDQIFNVREVMLSCGIVLGFFIFSALISLRISRNDQKGVFTQGAFRGNIAVIGTALVLNLYGELMFARAVMILAFVLPMFNILSVIALVVPLHGFTLKGLSHSLKNIARNPLILSVLTGLFFSIFRISLPPLIHNFLGYLSDMALPLALITVGGSLTWQGLKNKGSLALGAAFIKLILMPLTAVSLFYFLGYRGDDLGMIFIMTGAPTAVASHIMAEAMENDGELSALIVTLTTAMAAVTTMSGIALIECLS